MLDLTRHRWLLKGLSYFDRIKAFLLRRNRGDQESARQLGKFYARIWREAADSIGATIEDLGHEVFEIGLGGEKIRVQANATPIDDLATHCIVRTKPVIYKLLQEEGVPIPRHLAFSLDELPKAAEFLDSLGCECVVKPACDTGGGLGVATGIRTRWQLARAAQSAAHHSPTLLLEEQIDGDNYRLLYLDGELVDAVVRFPPRVIGDGRSRVIQLVHAANEQRLKEGAQRSHGLLRIDYDMNRTLAKQGLSLSAVPAAGQVVALKTASNENSAEDNVSAMSMVCPEVVAAGALAAALAGPRLAGVDVLTTNPGVPLEESGGVILEVNNPPGYYWHYHKRDGVYPVAEHVLRKLLLSHHDSLPFVAEGTA